MRINFGTPVGVSAKMPHHPHIDEILYVEGKHTIIIDRWIIEQYSDIFKEHLCTSIESSEGYYSLIVRSLNESSLWNGLSEIEQQDLKSQIIADFSFREYCYSSRINDAPSLFVYHSKQKDFKYRYQQFIIGEKDLWETLQEVFFYMECKDKTYGDEYEQQAVSPQRRNEIIQQMQQCTHQLLEMGMDKDEIRDNLFSSKQIQNLAITKNGNIELEQTIEGWSPATVILPPLDKAIYLLFLRHPEGINFNYLPDYREELTEIYKRLMNNRTTASMLQSIEEVTDPTNNSIYEKCARIRRAFIDVLGNYLAPSYYITGNRGEVKKIILDRSLVHWENEDFI